MILIFRQIVVLPSICVEMVESTMPFGRHFLPLLMATPQSTEQNTVLFEEGRYISGYLQHLLLRSSPHKTGGLCAECFSPLSGWTGTSVKEEHYMAKRTQYHSLASWFSKNVANLGLWHPLVSWGNWIVENEMPYSQVQGLLMKMHEQESTQAYKHTELRNIGCKKITIRACMTDQNDWAITPSHGEICCTIGRWITLAFPALTFSTFFPS